MKKVLILLMLVIPLAAYANDFGMQVPEWKNFAPTAFVDVKEPRGLGKLNVTAAYWYQRRVDFEDSLEICRGLEDYDERLSCYENLKVRQFKENTDYNARIEAQRQTSAIQEMNSKTDTMIPISGYLQNIGKFQPNEFK